MNERDRFFATTVVSDPSVPESSRGHQSSAHRDSVSRWSREPVPVGP